MRPLPAACFNGHACYFKKGSYGLGEAGVVPGLQLTLPAGWASDANGRDELSLIPALARLAEKVYLWLDPAAVKSTGTDHATVLSEVGGTPAELTSWIVGNSDFRVARAPRHVALGHGLDATSLTVAASPTAQYGDPDCPANPRCADLITLPDRWNDDFFGVGGDEEVRLYLATIQIGGTDHTVMLVLDAPGHRQLLRLEKEAQPVIDSLSWP